jgi:hypothetical protein
MAACGFLKQLQAAILTTTFEVFGSEIAFSWFFPFGFSGALLADRHLSVRPY